ncbi:Opacity protein [Paenimyroides ummariense]|uniref:Opacity protein n=1 Tax=Paenimyroides ummariense TaxID=913024 RepID=A0A1I5A7I7_9FLAO|nr:porin family protein [Paenimyroides ummariense]SFN58149.1 Opacity protein [Paenimyroides ummariense]
MKKVILAAFVLGTCTAALAQQQLKFGPKAGVNFANLSGVDNAEMKTGFHVGAVAEIKFNEKFSIQPEVVYSAQGAKANIGNIQGKANLDYINVPILAKYYIVDGFSVEAGPQIGFLAKAEGKGTVDNVSVTNDIKDNFKSTDFGLGFGLAYDLPVGVFVNARYNLGLSDIRNNTSSGDAIKNNVIQVGIGYKFD